ncbi:MAG: CinA family protein [Halofilum sp. (in: g-proteobacteria)]
MAAPSTTESLQDLAHRVGAVLFARGWRLVTAESCTGGGVAQAVTDIAGSSAWFECGFVTYSNAAKHRMLGVSDDTLRQFGAVSSATAEAMATGALTHSEADLAVAITGIAGPGGGSDAKPVGTVWFAWAVRGHPPEACCEQLNGDRVAIRDAAIRIALEGVADQGEEYDPI